MNLFPLEVNGMPVPSLWVERLRQESLRKVSRVTLEEVFGHEDVVDPLFFDEVQIINENSDWRHEESEAYIGKANDLSQPGDIDPERSLIIGDLGPDRLIALDFRENLSAPSVVYLTDHRGATWIEVASSIEDFLSKLGLC